MAPHTSHLAPTQLASYPGYTESPLRNVQLQSEVRTSGRRALRPAALDDTSRRNNSSHLQSTIYDALGSSEPVELLPHVSKRASIRHRGQSVTLLDEGIISSAIEGATTEAIKASGTQPNIQEEQSGLTTPHKSARVLEEVLYTTPPGCRAGRSF